MPDTEWTQDDLQLIVSQVPPDLIDALHTSPPDSVLHAVRHAAEKVADHATDDDPIECVGIIWDTGEITRMINQSRSEYGFSVGDSQLRDATTRAPEGWDISALYHSHPHGSPYLSSQDLSEMQKQWGQGIRLPWTIITTDGNLYTWFLDDDFQPVVAIYMPPFDLYLYGSLPTTYLPWSPN